MPLSSAPTRLPVPSLAILRLARLRVPAATARLQLPILAARSYSKAPPKDKMAAIVDAVRTTLAGGWLYLRCMV